MRAKSKIFARTFFHACDPQFLPSLAGSISRSDDGLRSTGMGAPSLPQCSSMFVCSCSCRMPRLDTNPAPAMPSTTCQTTLSASPNVFRTSSFNGCSRVGIDGIAANASWTPCGNCARNDAGRLFFSSFCRIAPPAVTPQICAARYRSVGQRTEQRREKGSRIQNSARTRRAPSRGLTA